MKKITISFDFDEIEKLDIQGKFTVSADKTIQMNRLTKAGLKYLIKLGEL